jgi:transglutaminase-like putative cysteine protease
VINLGYLTPNYKNTPVARYQTASQIAGAIVKAVGDSKKAADTLAPNFYCDTNYYNEAKLIFIFIKNAVPYVKEPGNNQTAKTLPRILADAKKYGGDCKHYATIAASLCKSLGIKCKLRLISQHFNSKTPNHIYCVAIINGKEVIIDPVLKNFDTEARYNYKYDINI